ncbi:MAG: hypothetical protein PHW41_06485 [Eubacteriales bacterium]|nr:hypothetical protein [Eubacteriales bacterium]
MEAFIIILAIFWVIVPLAMKKKQEQAKQEAERQRAARASAPKAAAPQQRVQQPMRTTPLAPTARAPMQASYEGSGSQEGYSGAVLQGEEKHDVKMDLSTAKSTLREAKSSITHTVTVSSISGHAHEETSATGIIAECPPDKTPSVKTEVVTTDVNATAFTWDVEAARSGLVMAEILGPCLAMRD